MVPPRSEFLLDGLDQVLRDSGLLGSVDDAGPVFGIGRSVWSVVVGGAPVAGDGQCARFLEHGLFSCPLAALLTTAMDLEGVVQVECVSSLPALWRRAHFRV